MTGNPSETVLKKDSMQPASGGWSTAMQLSLDIVGRFNKHTIHTQHPRMEIKLIPWQHFLTIPQYVMEQRGSLCLTEKIVGWYTVVGSSEKKHTVCCSISSWFCSVVSGRGSWSLRLRASSAEEIQSSSLWTSSLSASSAAKLAWIFWPCCWAQVWTWFRK